MVVSVACRVPSSTAAPLCAAEDFDCVTIGACGNPPFAGGPIGQMAGRAAVAYEYRLTRTEVTVGQWLEFLVAYEPFAPNPVAFSYGHGSRGYQLFDEGLAAPPMNMSWPAAAIYCDWLCNDKAGTAAFANGANGASTFTLNEDNTVNDQSTHHPESKWWEHPNGSDAELPWNHRRRHIASTSSNDSKSRAPCSTRTISSGSESGLMTMRYDHTA